LLLPVVLVAMSVLTAGVWLLRPHQPAQYDGPWANQADPGPILLVPGYGGHRAALDTLAGRLQAAGRTTTVVALPDHGVGNLVTEAAVLNGDVSAALRAGYTSVDLVGYSAGGVVVRLWLDRYQRYRVVRRVVTLGSPLHGTAIAALAALFLAGPDCPMACRQLAPFSDLMRGLNKSPVPTRLQWVSIWTRDDGTVVPPDSARLPGAVNIEAQQVCPEEVVSHSRLPTDVLVAGMVIDALDGPAWTAPPPAARCATLRALGAPPQKLPAVADVETTPASGR
jgi:triacylglycerol esterase/lipase EstA (alpha/beta hydrolase family)